MSEKNNNIVPWRELLYWELCLWPQEYFQKFKFAPAQIHRYVEAALRDLEIAKKDEFREVKFTYCNQALIKIGMAFSNQFLSFKNWRII